MKDPLGLFPDEPVAPVAAPKPAQNRWASLVVGLLVGVAVVLMYQRYSPDWIQPDGDDSEQVEPNKAGNAIVFVHELNPKPIEHVMLLRELPGFCKANGLEGGFLSLDDDLLDKPVPGLIQFAQTRGVSPPFVVLVDKNNKYIKAANFPSDLDDLKAFIK